MQMLIVPGDQKPRENVSKPAGVSALVKKFKGLGGKFSEEPTDEDTTAEGSTDVDQARMFVDAMKSGNPRRVLEAFKALVQCCGENENENTAEADGE